MWGCGTQKGGLGGAVNVGVRLRWGAPGDSVGQVEKME